MTTKSTKTSKTSKTSETAQEDPAVEVLRKELAAITLELEKNQEDLESAQAKLETVQSCLTATQVELKNTKDALATSELARQGIDLELEEANRHRVHPRQHEQQEVFVILKFQQRRPLPDGEYHYLARQRNAVDKVIERYQNKNSELDATEELRIDPSARAENVIQHIKNDPDSPIEFSRQNFILKKGKTEDEMIMYIQQAFSTYTQ
ncbi:hypothetical protein BGZ76_005141 [Entomortierella beljakovae]|nr:hypothetical protein BGZ76_005141 [Entomortierella beljakovae]